MHHYIEELNQRFNKDQVEVQERRNQWNNFSNFAIPIFEEIKIEATNAGFFETINYTRTDPHVSINQNSIILWAGKKHTGMSTITRTQTENQGIRTSWDAIVEDSGCLTIAQAPNGGVYFLVFSCKSNVYAWKDDHLVFKYFKNPKIISYKDIKEAVEFYLKFMLFTSFCSSPTLIEKIKLGWIKFKFAEQWYKMFKGAGTIAKIATGAFH